MLMPCLQHLPVSEGLLEMLGPKDNNRDHQKHSNLCKKSLRNGLS